MGLDEAGGQSGEGRHALPWLHEGSADTMRWQRSERRVGARTWGPSRCTQGVLDLGWTVGTQWWLMAVGAGEDDQQWCSRAA
jgi:hypothetical protein